MNSNLKRFIIMVATGAMMFQAAGCDLTLQAISTGLLAAIAGITFYLAKNV